MQMDGFERFGLRKDPFSTVSSEMISAIEEVHVSLAFDDHLGTIKETVFGMQQQAIVLLLGDQGAGKTEKLMVAAKEAEMNNVLSVMFSLSNSPKGGIAGLIDQVLVSAENNSIGGLFKSSDYLKYLEKAQKNGVSDPGTVGQAIAGLLNAYRPSFLLLDDLHNVFEMIDGQPFFSMMTTLLQQIQPGVLVLMTARPSFTNQAAAQNPSFPTVVTHDLTIPPLSEQDAEAILSRRIAESRMVDDIGPLYPFSSEAVQLLVQKSRGNPGQLLKDAHELLMAGLQQQSIMIDESIAGLIFSQIAMDDTIASTSESSEPSSKMQPAAEVWESDETEEESARFEPEVIPPTENQSTDEQTTHRKQNEEQPLITPPCQSEDEISKQLPEYDQYEPVEAPEEVEKVEEDNLEEWDEEELGIVEVSEAFDEPKTSRSSSNPATKRNSSDQQSPQSHNLVFDTQTWDSKQLLSFSAFNNKKTPKTSSSKDPSPSKKNQATPAATDASKVHKKKASSKKSSPKKRKNSSPTKAKTASKQDKTTSSSRKSTKKKSTPKKKKTSPSKKESKPSIKKKKQQKKQPHVSTKQESIPEEVNVQTYTSSAAPSEHRFPSEENVLHSNSMKEKLSSLTSRIRPSRSTGPEHALDYADKVRLLCPECKSTFVIQVSEMTELIHCPHCKFISTIT